MGYKIIEPEPVLGRYRVIEPETNRPRYRVIEPDQLITPMGTPETPDDYSIPAEVGKGIVRGLARGVAAVPRFGGDVADAVRRWVGSSPEAPGPLDTAIGGRKSALSLLGDVIDETVAEALPARKPESFWLGVVPEAIGQVVPMAGAGLGAGLARKGAGLAAQMSAATAASTAVGFMAEFDDAFQRETERQQKAGENDPDLAFVKALNYGTIAAALEGRFGAGRLARKWVERFGGESINELAKRGVSGGMIGRFLGRTAGDAATQGLEEAAQRLAQNVIIEGPLLPPEKLMEGIGTEGGAGAVVGTLLGFPANIPRRGRIPVQRMPSRLPPESLAPGHVQSEALVELGVGPAPDERGRIPITTGNQYAIQKPSPAALPVGQTPQAGAPVEPDEETTGKDTGGVAPVWTPQATAAARQALRGNLQGRTVNVPQEQWAAPSVHLQYLFGAQAPTWNDLVAAGVLELTDPAAPAAPGDLGVRLKREQPANAPTEPAPAASPSLKVWKAGQTGIGRGGMQYFALSKELADKFSEGGEFGRPGAVVTETQLPEGSMVFDWKASTPEERIELKASSWIEPDGYPNWHWFENTPGIQAKLRELGYNGIKLSEGESNGLSIAILPESKPAAPAAVKAGELQGAVPPEAQPPELMTPDYSAPSVTQDFSPAPAPATANVTQLSDATMRPSAPRTADPGTGPTPSQQAAATGAGVILHNEQPEIELQLDELAQSIPFDPAATIAGPVWQDVSGQDFSSAESQRTLLAGARAEGVGGGGSRQATQQSHRLVVLTNRQDGSRHAASVYGSHRRVFATDPATGQGVPLDTLLPKWQPTHWFYSGPARNRYRLALSPAHFAALRAQGEAHQQKLDSYEAPSEVTGPAVPSEEGEEGEEGEGLPAKPKPSARKPIAEETKLGQVVASADLTFTLAQAEELHELLAWRPGDSEQDIRDALADNATARPVKNLLIAVSDKFYRNEYKALAAITDPAAKPAAKDAFDATVADRAGGLVAGLLGATDGRPGFASALAGALAPTETQRPTPERAAPGADTSQPEVAPGTPQPLTAQETAEAARLGVREVTVQTEAEALAAINGQRQASGQPTQAAQGTEGALAFYDHGVIYYVRGQLDDDALFREVRAEEIGHHILSGPQAQEVIGQIADDPAFGAEMEGMAQRYPRFEGESEGAYRLRLANELLAQSRRTDRNLFQRLLDWIVERLAQWPGMGEWIKGSASNRQGILRALMRRAEAGFSAAGPTAQAMAATISPQRQAEIIAAQAEADAARAGGRAQVPAREATLFHAAQVLRRGAEATLQLWRQAVTRLDTLRYHNKEYVRARKTLEALRSFLQTEYQKLSQGDRLVLNLPEKVPGILDGEFVNALQTLGVGTRSAEAGAGEFVIPADTEETAGRLSRPPGLGALDANRIRALQAEVQTENQARGYAALLQEQARLRVWRRWGTQFDLGEEYQQAWVSRQRAVEERMKRIRQGNPEAARRGQQMSRDRITRGEVGEFDQASEETWLSRLGEWQAQQRAYESGPVRRAFRQGLEGARALADQWQTRLATFEEAMADPTMPEDARRRLAGEVLASWRQMQAEQQRFENLYAGRAGLLKQMRQLEDQLASAKITQGEAEGLIGRAIAALSSEAERAWAVIPTGLERVLLDNAEAIRLAARRLAKLPAWQGTRNARAVFERLTEQGRILRQEPMGRPVMTGEPLVFAAELGLSEEAYTAMLWALEHSESFRDAVETLAELADQKLAEVPVVPVQRIAELLEAGQAEQAQAAFEQLRRKLGNQAVAAEKAQAPLTRQLLKLAVQVRALDLGRQLFQAVLGEPGQPQAELTRLVRQVIELTLDHPPMIEANGDGTTYHAFPGQPAVTVRAASWLSPTKTQRSVSQWYEQAAEYLAGFEAAELAQAANPGQPTAEQQGYDYGVVLGLREALEQQDSDTNHALLLDEDRYQMSRWQGWSQKFSYGQQIWTTITHAAGLGRGALHRWALALGRGQAIGSRLLKRDFRGRHEARTAALVSHPECENNLERYQLLVMNPMGHLGRQWDSPLRVGYALDSGSVVTREDLAFLRLTERFGQAVRREITEQEAGEPGQRYLRGGVERQQGGQVVSRSLSLGVGDYALARVLNWGGFLNALRELAAAYHGPDHKLQSVGAETNLRLTQEPAALEAAAGWRVAAFWNEHLADLVRHVSDAGRTDSAVSRQPPLMRAALELRRRWEVGETGRPADLQELVEQLTAALPVNFDPGVPRARYVREQLLAELAEYGRGALAAEQEVVAEVKRASAEAEYDPVRVFKSEFTQEAARLRLPSRWYNYGAVREGEFHDLVARALSERAIQFRAALDRTVDGMQALRAQARDVSQPVAFESAQYPDLHNFSRALANLERLQDQMKAAGTARFREPGFWQELFGFFQGGLLSGVDVGFGNVILNAGFAGWVLAHLPGQTRRMTLGRELAGLFRGGLVLVNNVLEHTETGRALRRLWPASLRGFLAEQGALLEEVQRLGFSHREPFLAEARRLWQQALEFRGTEEQQEATAWSQAGRRVRAVLRLGSAALRKVGATALGDLATNATLVGQAGMVADAVRSMAGRYQARDLSQPFNAADPLWQVSEADVPHAWTAQRSQRLALLRLIFERADVSLERVLYRYSKAAQAAARTGGESPEVFTPEEHEKLKFALLALLNQPTSVSRQFKAQYDRTFKFLVTFQGWVANAANTYAELYQQTGRTRSLPPAARAATHLLPLLGTTLLFALVFGSINQWWRRKVKKHLYGIDTQVASILERDTWSSPGTAFRGAAVGTLSALPIAGDLALNWLNATVGGRGFDPASRVVGLNLMSSIFSAFRAAAGQPWPDKWMILTDFMVRPHFGLSGPLLYAGSPRYRGQREVSNVRRLIEDKAHTVLGIERRRSGQRWAGSDLSPTYAMRMKMASAAVREDWEEFGQQSQRLVEWHRQAGAAEPAKAALRDFQAMHPVARGAGRKLEAEEFARISSALSASQRQQVDHARQAWAQGETLLGAAQPRSAIHEARPAGRAGGGGGGTGTGGQGWDGVKRVPALSGQSGRGRRFGRLASPVPRVLSTRSAVSVASRVGRSSRRWAGRVPPMSLKSPRLRAPKMRRARGARLPRWPRGTGRVRIY